MSNKRPALTPFQQAYAVQYERERLLYETMIQSLRSGRVKTGEACARTGAEDTTGSSLLELEQRLDELHQQYRDVMGSD